MKLGIPTFLGFTVGGIGALVLFLSFSAAVSSACAQGLDEVLDAAGGDSRNGNYRAAAARLTSLSGSVARLSPSQQLIYWDLQADVAAASNLPLQAEQAARKHLAVLNEETNLAPYERRGIERRSLVRLARIMRTLSGAEVADVDAQGSTHLQEACQLYGQALKLSGAADEGDALWEAGVRLELARSLELLKQADRGKAEYAAAARSAETALATLTPGDETIDQFVHGAAIVRGAYMSDSAADKRRQAGQALKLYQARLSGGALSLAARVTILDGMAACYRQSQQQEIEQRVLARILDDVNQGKPGDLAEVEPSLRPEVMIRLAELAEFMADETNPAAGQAGQTSQPLYGEAAKVYLGELTRIKRPAAKPQADGTALSEDERIGGLFENLLQLQIVYVRVGDWAEAIKVTDELLKLRREVLIENDPNICRTISGLGSLHAKRARAVRMRMVGDEPDLRAARDDVERAQAHLKVALEFWRKHQPSSPRDLVSTLNYYAEVLRYDGDFRGAEAMLNEVAAVLSVKPIYGADDMRLAEFYTNRAAVQAALGQFYPAQVNYDRAARIVEGGTQPVPGRELRERRKLQATIYLNLAQLYKSQRQFGEARRKCEKAVAAAETAGIRGPELAPFELANVSLLIAEAEHDVSPASLTSTNEADSAEGRLNQVRQNLEKAVRLAMPIAAGDLPLERATAGHLEALARYRLHELFGDDPQQLPEAERLWTRIVEQSGDELPQIVNLRARASNYLVAIALSEAAAARRLSHELSQAEMPDEPRIAEATKQSEARLQQAVAWSQAGEQAAEQMVAYPAVRVQALLSRALVLSAQAQIRRAKAAREQATEGRQAPFAPPTPQKEPVPEDADAKKLTDDAIATLQEAVKLIEMPRAMTVGAEGERALYFAQFAPVFDLLVELLSENGRYVEAIQAADLRRSRTFQDQLRACGVDLTETADRELAKAAREAAERYYAMVNRLKENWADVGQRQQLSDELEVLRGKFVRAEQEMKSTSVAARQLLLESGETAEIASELRANDWSNDEVALIYYVGLGKSYVFACGGKLDVVGQPLTVTPEQARQRGLRITQQEDSTQGSPLRADHVVQLMRDVRAGVEKLPDDANRKRASRGSQALALSYSAKVGPETDYIVTDILLPPALRQKIAEADPSHLIVIPDGALHQLPLELLPYDRERTKYVLDEMPPISYAPSLLIERKLRTAERMSGQGIALLSLADPSYSQAPAAAVAEESGKVSSAGNEFRQHWGGGFARLEGFKKESAAVCDAFANATSGRGRIVTLRENDATERQFKATVEAQANRIGFLHVAAHGLVSQEYNNLFGALALTPPDRLTEDDDGYLSLHEMFDLKLRGCEMVVLSACDTNRGAESPLEAGSTMARAFICAGATRVVCSHWGADDNSTTALVSDFMKQVSSELSANRTVDFATALHAAKKKLRDNMPSPYFWAPFVLIGPPSNEGFGDRKSAVAVK